MNTPLFEEIESFTTYKTRMELLITLYTFANRLVEEKIRHGGEYQKVFSKTYTVNGATYTGAELCKQWIDLVLTIPALQSYNKEFGVYTRNYVVQHAAANGVHLSPADAAQDYTIYVTKDELKQLAVLHAKIKAHKVALPTLTKKHDKEMKKLYKFWLDLMTDGGVKVPEYTAAECKEYSNILCCLVVKYIFNTQQHDFEDYQLRPNDEVILDLLEGFNFRSACKDAIDVYPNAAVFYYILTQLPLTRGSWM